jgi:hypothetical protein
MVVSFCLAPRERETGPLTVKVRAAVLSSDLVFCTCYLKKLIMSNKNIFGCDLKNNRFTKILKLF